MYWSTPEPIRSSCMYIGQFQGPSGYHACMGPPQSLSGHHACMGPLLAHLVIMHYWLHFIAHPFNRHVLFRFTWGPIQSSCLCPRLGLQVPFGHFECPGPLHGPYSHDACLSPSQGLSGHLGCMSLFKGPSGYHAWMCPLLTPFKHIACTLGPGRCFFVVMNIGRERLSKGKLSDFLCLYTIVRYQGEGALYWSQSNVQRPDMPRSWIYT